MFHKYLYIQYKNGGTVDYLFFFFLSNIQSHNVHPHLHTQGKAKKLKKMNELLGTICFYVEYLTFMRCTRMQ